LGYWWIAISSLFFYKEKSRLIDLFLQVLESLPTNQLIDNQGLLI
jgi:hypothetical protein